MYQSHWGLQESPFRNCLDPRFFYQSPTHEEALARLGFLVDERRRLGMLMGPAGSGKSLVLEIFAAGLRRRGLQVVKINLLGLGAVDMLSQAAGQFGLCPDADSSVFVLWRALSDRLLEYRYQQLPVVFLLDDVDRAPRETLVHVARLAQNDLSPDSRVTLILAGDETQVGRLGGHLLSLSELRVDLQPWEEADTEAFVEQSLAQAGRSKPVFDPPAVARLHELSHGIPRRARQLADLALLAGAGRQLDQIDADVVESVYEELAVVG